MVFIILYEITLCFLYTPIFHSCIYPWVHIAVYIIFKLYNLSLVRVSISTNGNIDKLVPKLIHLEITHLKETSTKNHIVIALICLYTFHANIHTQTTIFNIWLDFVIDSNVKHDDPSLQPSVWMIQAKLLLFFRFIH